MIRFRNEYNCLLLKIPERRPNIPIQPGLFKGNYGFHGIELLMLEYSSADNGAQVHQALLTKITVIILIILIM